MAHFRGSPRPRRDNPRDFVRIAVGLESVRDLQNDLARGSVREGVKKEG